MSEAPGMHDPTFLPSDIPAPQEDGRARHLTGLKLPNVALPATSGGAVNLSLCETNGGKLVPLPIKASAGLMGIDW